MSQHVGEEFDGTVSTVTNFGLFITLNELFIDGLVHVSNVGNDYFVYDERQQQLIGKDTGLLFGLGDQVRVQVAGVNMDLLQIDFELLAKLKASEMNQSKADKTTKSKTKKRNNKRNNKTNHGGRSGSGRAKKAKTKD